MSFLASLEERSTRDVDVASLAAFRIAFGVVMLGSTVRYVARGWVTTQLAAPRFHFAYGPLTFIRPLPEAGLFSCFGVLAVTSILIAVGFRHRIASAAFFAVFSYVELIDQATYLNHYYLVSLLAFLLALLPAGDALSLEARRSPKPGRIPAWMLWALRLQIGVVYVYAGMAKLNEDWLFRAEPLRMWLAAKSDVPLVGPLLEDPATAYVASWAGAAFDLGVVPALLHPRTRRAAFAAAVVFHVVTGALLPIGIFPFVMIAGLTVFLDPAWPRRWMSPAPSTAPQRARRQRAVLAAVLLVHSAVQVVLPLRSVLFPTRAAWTLAGFNYSWRVMVAEKSGTTELRVVDLRTSVTRRVAPSNYLTGAQERAMAQDPEMIRMLSRHVAEEERRKGRDVAVYADAFASLNGRGYRRLLRPDVDLTRDVPDDWVLAPPP